MEIIVKVIFLLSISSFAELQVHQCSTLCTSKNNEKIRVHLIPHSHNDLGWVKTKEQYYFGGQDSIQNAGVQYIITSYVEALKRNPNRTFIQVETGFFFEWWTQQTTETQNDYKRLVRDGQIELVNGAWSMNDEASTNYQSIIDQFTLGLKTLKQTLGDCAKPTIGWQIDPFGHTREMASLYAQMYYDGFFLGRLDYRDKDIRENKTQMDFVWRSSANLDNSEVFGSVLIDFYTSPENFCFDINCSDEPIVTDPKSSEYNLMKRKEEFKKIMQENSKVVPTKNVLVPMGGDFHYQAAFKNYINMDRLINAFEGDPEIEVIYSTPSCYIQNVHEEAERKSIKLALKTDDFFPYASDPHAFWSGHFSSRPTIKRFERLGNNILQAHKQMAVLVNDSSHINILRELEEAMGLMQHHDAITGTEKQAVADDYVKTLHQALINAESNIGHIVKNLLITNKSQDGFNISLASCLLSNVTVCETSEWEKFLVVVYNPLEQHVNETVRIPVSGNSYNITGPNGLESSEVIPSIVSFSYVKVDPKPTGKELVFRAQNIPPLGMNLYYVESGVEQKMKKNIIKKKRQSNSQVISPAFDVDPVTNLLSAVHLPSGDLAIRQEFLYYDSAVGDNDVSKKEWWRRASGAYIFRPNATHLYGLPVSNKVEITRSVDDGVVQEVHQKVNEWIQQVIRVDRREGWVEFDWVVGPVPVNEPNLVGKEIISRFTILEESFDTNSTFYTDSNGREMLERKINSRNGYHYNATEEPVAGNYYPINSRIVIQDSRIRVAVLTDRAQGGTHLIINNSATVELMVHRRILHDDAFGVAEALNETEYGQGLVVRGQHFLVIGPRKSKKDGKNTLVGSSTIAEERKLAQRKLLRPYVLTGKADFSLDYMLQKFNFQYSGLIECLPENVHILSLQSWEDNSCLLRLEHIFEKGEDDDLSKDIDVDIKGLFRSINVTTVEEKALGANQPITSRPRYLWNTTEATKLPEPLKRNIDNDTIIHLSPMEIKTLVINHYPAETP